MKSIVAWFARNDVAANLLLGIIVVGGFVALSSMPQKSFPDIDVPVIQIGVEYRGAAPEEAEKGVCIRIEEEIEGIEGVERIRSTAVEGACSVSVELFEETDEREALDEVKNRIDAIDTFPEETEKPIINLVSPERSVMEIALTGPRSERGLKELGQQIRDEIASLPGITQVELSNTRHYEISIEVSEASLRRHGLSFDAVAEAIRRASLDLPGGAIKTEGGEVLLRTEGQAYWGPEFEELIILTRPNGTRIRVRDIGEVVDGFEDTDQRVRFDGKAAAIVRVARVGDQDILEMTATLKSYLEDARSRLPSGVGLTIWSDNSVLLQDRLDTLLDSARQGFLMVLALLALFLRPRLSFWVSVGVPVSFLGSLALIALLGLSIDAISLFGFILVLGILVDDAIVVGENVYSHQTRNENWLQAAIQGTQEVSVPVIFGVLTTVAAFTPLLIGPGTIGQIQNVIGTVVICCLIFSLIESQLVLPAHLGHRHAEAPAAEVGLMLIPIIGIALVGFASDIRTYLALALVVATGLYAWHWQGGFDRMAEGLIALQGRFSNGLERMIRERFGAAVDRAIERRYVTIAVAFAVFVATLGALASGRLPFSFFPPLESDRVIAKLTMPLGTPAEVTEGAVLRLETMAESVATDLALEFPTSPPVMHVLSAVGGHPVSSDGSGAPGETASLIGGGHMGEVTMQLTPSQARALETREVADLWRERVGHIQDAVELTFGTSLFSVGQAINIQLEGNRVEELKEVAAEIRTKLAEYPGVIDISDSFRSGKAELKLDILPSGEALGLGLGDLARQVRQAFYGEEVQRVQRGRDDVRVMVRYPESDRRSLGALDDMRIRTPDGSEVPFATVASAQLGQGFSTIRRSDRRRVVNVTADVDRTQITANEVIADLQAGALDEIMQDHPRVTTRLEGAQREQSEAMSSLLPTFGLALFVIYALLAIPLRSYLQPFIIMSVLPFAFVGAIWGHIFMKTFGLVSGLAMMSVVGIIAASGVVVNSSLVLVHSVNGRREQGLSIRRSAQESAVARFRPILLTSMTTFVGLLPLMLNRSVQAQFLVPMAISLAFGVAFSTLVTVLVVPAVYVILEDVRGLPGGATPQLHADTPPQSPPPKSHI